MPKVVRERLLAEIERQKKADAGPTDQQPDATTPETKPELAPETTPEIAPEIAPDASGPCASACKLNTFERCYPENTAGCAKVGDKYECKGICGAGQRFCEDLGGQCPEWTTCRNATTPNIEECNGKDDDCDGEIDNISRGTPLRRDCYGGPDGTQGKGICRPGTQTCAGGQWDKCTGDVQPDTKETCNNGKDDNCDGLVDEECICAPDAKQDCGNPDKGECKRGKQICASNGKWGECLGEIKPATEICDGKDNDCNGQTDENVTQSCYEGPSGTEGKGPCIAGKRECTAGKFGPCLGQKLPQTELCNGIDDDCDGEIDEASPGKKLTQSCYTGPAGTRGIGECKDGIATCDSSGKWGACVGEITPTTDGCDGIDKDCDGTTDEGCVCKPAETRACGNPTKGKCKAGTETCNNSGQWGTCQGEIKPTTETCNNEDDDCDGNIDNGLTRPCNSPDNPKPTTGLCKPGTETCKNGNWGSCTGEVKPATEICNNKDDDCDGAIDNGLVRSCYTGSAGTQNVGPCSGGIQSCSNGNWGTCTGEVTPKAEETCNNNIDDDCDGKIDNGCVITLAGTGVDGFKDGSALQAQLSHYATGITVSSNNEVFLADKPHNCIRKLNSSYTTLTTYAGQCQTSGNSNGTGDASTGLLNAPEDVVVDQGNNIYIADTNNHCIRKVDQLGKMTTFVGVCGQVGDQNGHRTSQVRLNQPRALAYWGNSKLYFTTQEGTGSIAGGLIKVLDISTNQVTKVYGPGLTGARISMSVDQAGNVYFSTPFCIEKLSFPAYTNTTVSCQIKGPELVASPSGLLYTSFEGGAACLKTLDPITQVIQVLAGDCSGIAHVDGPISAARFSSPGAVTLDNQGSLFVVDKGRIRKLTKK